MNVYIHHSACISPQNTFGEIKLNQFVEHTRVMAAIEPSYSAIPPRELRRMGKVVRMGLGTAQYVLDNAKNKPRGIIIGTGNGGMEHCVLFLKQITEYDEGVLTPGNFVQSTSNAIAATIGIATQNFGYNNTHVHEGLAFEMALIDAQMQLGNNPNSYYLLGGLDDIATYNNNIDNLAGWNRLTNCSNKDLFTRKEVGTIPGEAAAMFLVSDQKKGANSEVIKVETWHGKDPTVLHEKIDKLKEYCNAKGIQPDVIISGNNGDSREETYYDIFENSFNDCALVRFKHLCGDYPTAGSFGVWLANYLIEEQKIPLGLAHDCTIETINTVIIYNGYHQNQHSLLLLKKA